MSFPEATTRGEAHLESLTHGLPTAEAFPWVSLPQCGPYRATEGEGYLQELFLLSTWSWNTFTIFKRTNIEFSTVEHLKIFFKLNEHISNKDHVIFGFDNHLEFSKNAAAFLREQVEIAIHILKRSLFLFSNSFYLRSLDVSASLWIVFFQSRACIAIVISSLLTGLRRLNKPFGFDHLRKFISQLKAFLFYFIFVRGRQERVTDL